MISPWWPLRIDRAILRRRRRARPRSSRCPPGSWSSPGATDRGGSGAAFRAESSA